MLYPNARYTFYMPLRYYGPLPGLQTQLTFAHGARLNIFLSENLSKVSGVPDGYSVSGIVPPITGCSLSSFTYWKVSDFTAALLKGGPIIGSFTVTSTTDGALSLTVTLAGSFVTGITGTGTLKLSSKLNGSFVCYITGDGSLNIIVPVEGSFVSSLTGSADLRMKLSLQGEWTPYTELSPENLAAAVWNALAEMFNEPGTMGQKLNSAASAGDPWVAELPGNYTGNQAGSIIGRELMRLKWFLALK